MKKKYLLYVVMPVTVFIVMGTAAVYANSSNSGFNNSMRDLATAIAQRFNLNVSDVQQVFDEQKAKMDAQREEQRAQMEGKRNQGFTDRINQAVTDGKLTQDQADKIIAKKAEFEAQRTNLEGKTEEDRQAAMIIRKKQMDSLKQWATDNGIPQEYIPFLGFGIGGRHGGPGGPGFGRLAPDRSCDSAANSSAQSE